MPPQTPKKPAAAAKTPTKTPAQTPAPRPPARDLIGYGATPPDPQWPDGAYVGVNFCVNYEEGG
ncbi:MAG: hypothetical protein AAFW46_15005, partial [Pseudomonadota bacterium]